MMKNRSEIIPHQPAPYAEPPDWEALYERICLVAMRRSSGLLFEDDETSLAFDRGARALRALMGAAEIARRMKSQDEKEKDLNDEEKKPAMLSDEELAEIFWSLEAKVEEFERKDGCASTERESAAHEKQKNQTDNRDGGAREPRRSGGENLEGSRS